MKEYKFRMWDGKRMTVSGIMFNTTTGSLMSALNAPIMQYTGFKDIKGTEIYEGDIVYREHWGNTVVSYDEEHYAFTMDLYNNVLDQEGGPDSEVEVVGNIYENPGIKIRRA